MTIYIYDITFVLFILKLKKQSPSETGIIVTDSFKFVTIQIALNGRFISLNITISNVSIIRASYNMLA